MECQVIGIATLGLASFTGAVVVVWFLHRVCGSGLGRSLAAALWVAAVGLWPVTVPAVWHGIFLWAVLPAVIVSVRAKTGIGASFVASLLSVVVSGGITAFVMRIDPSGCFTRLRG
jgi:hypothetical protein